MENIKTITISIEKIIGEKIEHGQQVYNSNIHIETYDRGQPKRVAVARILTGVLQTVLEN